jgi:hypothetical protein
MPLPLPLKPDYLIHSKRAAFQKDIVSIMAGKYQVRLRFLNLVETTEEHNKWAWVGEMK